MAGERVAAVPRKDYVPINYAPDWAPSFDDYLLRAGVSTDMQGRFNGRFTVSTGWALALRPPPPELSKVFLYVREPAGWQVIQVPIRPADQRDANSGTRKLRLGAIILQASQ
jgi:hypothetical protein